MRRNRGHKSAEDMQVRITKRIHAQVCVKAFIYHVYVTAEWNSYLRISRPVRDVVGVRRREELSSQIAVGRRSHAAQLLDAWISSCRDWEELLVLCESESLASTLLSVAVSRLSVDFLCLYQRKDKASESVFRVLKVWWCERRADRHHSRVDALISCF